MLKMLWAFKIQIQLKDLSTKNINFIKNITDQNINKIKCSIIEINEVFWTL